MNSLVLLLAVKCAKGLRSSASHSHPLIKLFEHFGPSDAISHAKVPRSVARTPQK